MRHQTRRTTFDVDSSTRAQCGYVADLVVKSYERNRFIVFFSLQIIEKIHEDFSCVRERGNMAQTFLCSLVVWFDR